MKSSFCNEEYMRNHPGSFPILLSDRHGSNPVNIIAPMGPNKNDSPNNHHDRKMITVHSSGQSLYYKFNEYKELMPISGMQIVYLASLESPQKDDPT